MGCDSALGLTRGRDGDGPAVVMATWLWPRRGGCGGGGRVAVMARGRIDGAVLTPSPVAETHPLPLRHRQPFRPAWPPLRAPLASVDALGLTRGEVCDAACHEGR